MPDKLTDNLANNSPILANELSDGEIKKALECCKKDDCDNCPNDFGNCYSNLSGYALDLINRQEDENNELQLKIASYNSEVEKLNKIILKGDFSSITALRAREHWFRQNTEHINRLNAEIERLKEELNSVKYAFRGFEEEIKAEAYKEVADNIERAFSKTESQIPNIEVVEKTVQICRNAIRKVLNELVSDGDDHE